LSGLIGNYISVIEKYYAAHIKTNLDAAAINIMRARPTKKQLPAKNRKRDVAGNQDSEA
jgi:hypothetical protein